LAEGAEVAFSDQLSAFSAGRNHVKDFHSLDVWQKSHALALAVYEATKAFPPDERFALTSQLRRAASSVPANLSEGCGRDGDAELSRFARIAMGSASELEYHLLLARDLGYLSTDRFEPLTARTVEVKRMLARFIQRLRSDL
jgi:four helix bundle protein